MEIIHSEQSIGHIFWILREEELANESQIFSVRHHDRCCGRIAEHIYEQYFAYQVSFCDCELSLARSAKFLSLPKTKASIERIEISLIFRDFITANSLFEIPRNFCSMFKDKSAAFL